MQTRGYEQCVLIRFKLGCVDLCRGVVSGSARVLATGKNVLHLTQVTYLMAANVTGSKKDLMTHVLSWT